MLAATTQARKVDHSSNCRLRASCAAPRPRSASLIARCRARFPACRATLVERLSVCERPPRHQILERFQWSIVGVKTPQARVGFLSMARGQAAPHPLRRGGSVRSPVTMTPPPDLVRGRRHRLALGVLPAARARRAGPLPGDRRREPDRRSRRRVRRALGRADVPDGGRAARRRGRARLHDRVGAVGGHTRRHARARRPGHARARRDAARARPGRAAGAVGRRRRERGAGRRAVLADAGARGAARGGARRGHRRADVGPGLLDAPLPRGLDDPRAAGGRLPARRRVSARLHRSAGRSRQLRRLARRQRAQADVDHDRDDRLRGPHGPLRLHRQPVVEPAAHAPDRRPRLDG